VLGDRSGCKTQLGLAEKVRTSSTGDEDLSTPITAGVIAGHAGTCWIDLGITDVQLARLALLQHDVHRASAHGSLAAELLAGTTSYRSAHHLWQLTSAVHQLDHTRPPTSLTRPKPSSATAAGPYYGESRALVRRGPKGRRPP
jgi:hypothetical protein